MFTKDRDSFNSNSVSDIEATSLKKWRFEIMNLDAILAINKYKKTSLAKGLLQYISDWFVIFLSFRLTIFNPFFLPISLLLIGSRQRALSNLIHDGSHFNLTRNKALNDFFVDLFAGISLASPVRHYRKTHLLHHRYLGILELDPDLKTHLSYNYNDYSPPYSDWRRNYLFLIFNLKSLRDSLLGDLKILTNTDKIVFFVWWFVFSIIFLKTLTLFFGFIAIWYTSRLTFYHFIRVTAEFIDHSGLSGTGLLKNCRIIVNPNYFLRILIHPHNDHLHALHHLEPKVPAYNLRGLNETLLGFNSSYNKIKRNDSYLLGPFSALKDLTCNL